MEKIWTDTIDVVAYALAALNTHVKLTKNRQLSLDSLMLASLMHNIGVLPILTEAERHAEVFANPTFLDVAIDKLSGEIGAGIMIKWGLTQLNYQKYNTVKIILYLLKKHLI